MCQAGLSPSGVMEMGIFWIVAATACVLSITYTGLVKMIRKRISKLQIMF